MPNIDLAAVQQLSFTTLWLSLALGLVFGAVMQYSHFCTMGAVADWVNFGDTGRARMAAVAIAVAIVGTQLLAAFNVIDLSQSIYTGGRLMIAAYVIGGLSFGFGMVLAGGCASKTLLRMGGGSLKALIVFLVMGLVAWMTLKGILGVLRVNVIEPLSVTLPTQDIPKLLSLYFGRLSFLHVTCAAIFGGSLAVWVFYHPESRNIKTYTSGALIGLCVVAAWFISGSFGFVSEHPDTLAPAFLTTNSGRMESLSFTAPTAYWLDYLVFFSDKSKVLSYGMMSTLGIVLGACAVSVWRREFAIEGFSQTRDMGQHMVGGALMGFGGVLAMGCTVGQGLSGISTLAIGSFITLLFIVLGAIATLKYQAATI